MKVFVTAGSSEPFDDLIRVIDAIVAKHGWQGRAQIGDGSFRPVSLQWYNFRSSIKPDMEWADIIITHSGSSTLFEAIRTGKKIVAVHNPASKRTSLDAVQWASTNNFCLYKTLEDLPDALSHIEAFTPAEYSVSPCQIAESVMAFLLGMGGIKE
jgi:UDP-N-acetylglucosamine transferase subunit ALG13